MTSLGSLQGILASIKFHYSAPVQLKLMSDLRMQHNLHLESDSPDVDSLVVTISLYHK